MDKLLDDLYPRTVPRINNPPTRPDAPPVRGLAPVSPHIPSVGVAAGGNKTTGDRLQPPARVGNVQSPVAQIHASSPAVDPLKALTRKAIVPTGDNVQTVPPAKRIQFVRGDEVVNITLDPSQVTALDGLVGQKFGCLTGAAGTGKTTIEHELVSMIEDSVQQGNLANYGKVNPNPEAKEHYAPLIAFCAYTGKAMQQMKKALSEDHISRCFTIHKLLGFHPIYEDVWDEELETEVSKRRFVPFYTADNKLPWEVIIIDEASMVPIQLWHQLLEACKNKCRIYMIGDINQLPPVHGRSVFGFALQKWPSFELTQIHRQKGNDNPIVDNAWKILQGQIPKQVAGRFDMIRLPPSKMEAVTTLYKVVTLIRNRGEFSPEDTDDCNGDMVIVPQNVDILGQEALNQYFIGMFNPSPSPEAETTTGRRTLVIAGYDKRTFAVGDKVMVTYNDHDLAITNGMTGKVVGISVNSAFGAIRVGGETVDINALSSDDLMAAIMAPNEGAVDVQDKEEIRKRAASHIIRVDFGPSNRDIDEKDHWDEYNEARHIVEFSAAGPVNGLIPAYAVTCHKMQGSEVPTAIIVCHSSNHRMLYREWLYTAVTRASQRVVLLYDNRGLSMALNRQKIKGDNLQQKAQTFIDLQTNGDAIVPILQEPEIIEHVS